jgi:hypothetical protein
VQLGAADLQDGSILYRKLGSSVRFRLELVLTEKASVVQAIEWGAPATPSGGTRSLP